MMNQVVLIGRLVDKPTIKELESGKKVSEVCLAVQRCFKNSEGVYDTDFIDVTLWDAIASNTTEYCQKGDLVGIKGRLQVETYEVNEEKRKRTIVLAEKVTFLASKKQDSEEE